MIQENILYQGTINIEELEKVYGKEINISFLDVMLVQQNIWVIDDWGKL